MTSLDGIGWRSFCGDTAAKTLGTRLDAQQVADLRRELTPDLHRIVRCR